MGNRMESGTFTPKNRPLPTGFFALAGGQNRLLRHLGDRAFEGARRRFLDRGLNKK